MLIYICTDFTYFLNFLSHFSLHPSQNFSQIQYNLVFCLYIMLPFFLYVFLRISFITFMLIKLLIIFRLLQTEGITFPTCCRSVAKSCPSLCDPMNCSMLGFSVLQYLLEFAQTPVHCVSDTIQPSLPLSPPSPALNLSQHQGLF